MTLDLNAIKARVDKAFASLAKAYPYLVKHADHIDGEFALALSTLRREVARLTAERDEAVASASALEKLVEPGEPHGEPTVNLATLLSTAKRVTRAEEGLATLTADHAALRTAVERVRKSGKCRCKDREPCPRCDAEMALDDVLAALGGGNG